MNQRYTISTPSGETHIYMEPNLPEQNVIDTLDEKLGTGWHRINYNSNIIHNPSVKFIGGIANAFKSVGKAVGRGASKAYDAVKPHAKNAGNKALQIGAQAGNKAWKGVKKAGQYAWESAKDMAPDLYEKAGKQGEKIVKGAGSAINDLFSYGATKLEQYQKYQLLQTRQAKKEFTEIMKKFEAGVLKHNGKAVTEFRKALALAVNKAYDTEAKMAKTLVAERGAHVIVFDKWDTPDKRIYNYAKEIKDKYPKVWDLGGNIFGNTAFKNLERVINRGYWLDKEEWMYKKWQSFIRRHARNKRIEGKVALLKWLSWGNGGREQTEELVDNAIKHLYNRKYANGGIVKWQVYYMDNDGQKRIVEKNISYQQAVKLSQQRNSSGISSTHEYEPMNKKYSEGGVIDLKPLSEIPLSTQLQRLTGNPYNSIDFTNEDGSRLGTEILQGRVIIHKKTGNKYRIPLKSISLNSKGGFNYDFRNGSEQAVWTAEKVDLLTLPKNVEGTNCSNCSFYQTIDKEKGYGFCKNEKIKLPVTSRMCCALWDNKNATRQWKKFEEGGPVEYNPFNQKQLWEKQRTWIVATLTNDETSTDEELVNYFITEGKMKYQEAKHYVSQRDKFLKELQSKDALEKWINPEDEKEFVDTNHAPVAEAIERIPLGEGEEKGEAPVREPSLVHYQLLDNSEPELEQETTLIEDGNNTELPTQEEVTDFMDLVLDAENLYLSQKAVENWDEYDLANYNALRKQFAKEQFQTIYEAGNTPEDKEAFVKYVQESKEKLIPNKFLVIHLGQCNCYHKIVDALSKHGYLQVSDTDKFDEGGVVIKELISEKKSGEKLYELKGDFGDNIGVVYFKVYFVPQSTGNNKFIYKPDSTELWSVMDKNGDPIDMWNIPSPVVSKIGKIIENFRLTQADASDWKNKYNHGGTMGRKKLSDSELRAVGATILYQIGVDTLKKVDAHSYMLRQDKYPSLTFKLGEGYTYKEVTITRNRKLDTYDIIIKRVQTFPIVTSEVIESIDGVYADALTGIVEEAGKEKFAKGGNVLDNYKSELENMTYEELAHEYANETGIDEQDALSDIDDERNYYINELVYRFERVLKSRGEKYAQGGPLAQGIKVEKEHRDLYLELKKRLKNKGIEMPISEHDFYAKIAGAHIKESPKYYELLEQMEKQFEHGGDTGDNVGPISVAKLKAFNQIDFYALAKEEAGPTWAKMSKDEQNTLIADMEREWDRNHSFEHGGIIRISPFMAPKKIAEILRNESFAKKYRDYLSFRAVRDTGVKQEYIDRQLAYFGDDITALENAFNKMENIHFTESRADRSGSAISEETLNSYFSYHAGIQHKIFKKYGEQFEHGGEASEFELATTTIKTFPNDKHGAESWMNEYAKENTSHELWIEEVEYDWGIDYRVMEKYPRRKMQHGGEPQGVIWHDEWQVDYFPKSRVPYYFNSKEVQINLSKQYLTGDQLFNILEKYAPSSVIESEGDMYKIVADHFEVINNYDSLDEAFKNTIKYRDGGIIKPNQWQYRVMWSFRVPDKDWKLEVWETYSEKEALNKWYEVTILPNLELAMLDMNMFNEQERVIDHRSLKMWPKYAKGGTAHIPLYQQGGKIIGYTGTGKPVYDKYTQAPTDYIDSDFKDAGNIHSKLAKKTKNNPALKEQYQNYAVAFYQMYQQMKMTSAFKLQQGGTARMGGFAQGPSHADGGIPGIVASTGQAIEFEGDEAIINKTNMRDTHKYAITKAMTLKEFASCINEANGNGVNFREDDTPCPLKRVD